MGQQRYFLVDSSTYIFRAYFALGAHWHSRDGLPTEAVYGFAAFLLKLLARERPDYIAAAFDESLTTGFRHRLYPAYKANRALPDELLAFQLNACQQLAGALGIQVLASSEYEADDLIASLAVNCPREVRCHVLSGDKDLAQLLAGDTLLWDYGRREPVGREQFIADTGLAPEVVPDFLALVGDSADNIPGVPGIGVKTATAILQLLGPLTEWLHEPRRVAELPLRGAPRIADRLAAHAGQVGLALELARLRYDINDLPAIRHCAWQGFSQPLVEELFTELGIASLLPRTGKLP